MTLTRTTIDALRTHGTFTTATIEALGLEWARLDIGWPDRMIGREMSDEAYAKALAGMGVTKRKRREARFVANRHLKLWSEVWKEKP